MAPGKLVRDRIPDIIMKEGRRPVVRTLEGEAFLSALYDKLAEEHRELLAAKSEDERLEELADIVEVVLSLAARLGVSESDLMGLVARKRAERGGFSEGFFYEGDV